MSEYSTPLNTVFAVYVVFLKLEHSPFITSTLTLALTVTSCDVSLEQLKTTVAVLLSADQLQPADAGFGIGPAVAVGTAEAAEFFHGIQIVAVVADPAHPADGLAVFRYDGDSQIIGNGENLGLNAVGGKAAADAFFHTEGFGSGHGQFIAQIGGHIQQGVVIHRITSKCKVH